MMNYKGYLAQVQYDNEAKIFAGEVINTKSVITFQGTSVEELEAEFRASVDDYLDWCKEEGVAPEKPYSGKFNVRITPQLHQKAALESKKEGISLNKFIENAIETKLNTANQIL